METDDAGVAAEVAAVEAGAAKVDATDDAVEEVAGVAAIVAAPTRRHREAGAEARLGTPSSATGREGVNQDHCNTGRRGGRRVGSRLAVHRRSEAKRWGTV